MATAIDSEMIHWLTVDRSLAILYLATSTCVVYDHLTTLGDEVELVWKREKWSVVQYLFFLNRYLGDAAQIFACIVFIRHVQKGTEKLYVMQLKLSTTLGLLIMTPVVGNLINSLLGYMISGVLCSMQAIMVYRVSTMYLHRRQVVILLVGALMLETISVLAIQSTSAIRGMPVPTPVPNVHFCTQDAWSNWMFTIWIPVALFESLVFGLSLLLALAYHRWKELDTVFRFNPESLAYILFRDSITFPFICLSFCIANFVVWITQPYMIIQIAFAAAAFVPCILGPRLILNLREAYYLPFTEECNAPDSIPNILSIPHTDHCRNPPRVSVNVESPTEDIHLITLDGGARNFQDTTSRGSCREQGEF